MGYCEMHQKEFEIKCPRCTYVNMENATTVLITESTPEQTISPSAPTGSSPSSSLSQKIVEVWNDKHPVGSAIHFIDDSARAMITSVTSPATIQFGVRVAQVSCREEFVTLERLL